MPKISIMSIEDYIRTDFLPSRADDEIAELIDAWIIASNYSRHYVLTYNTQQDLISDDKFISYLAQEDPVIQEYTEYVTNRISGLNLSDAISTVENVSHKIQNLRDITLPCITNAVEKCLSQLVDKSSTEDIHHAIELNEEHNLVDLSELDKLLYPHAKTQPAIGAKYLYSCFVVAPDDEVRDKLNSLITYLVFGYNDVTREVLYYGIDSNQVCSSATWLTTSYDTLQEVKYLNKADHDELVWYLSSISSMIDTQIKENEPIPAYAKLYAMLQPRPPYITSKQLSQVRALTHTPSLADDLQAATQAANRQHQQSAPKQQSHNLKL